MGDFEYWITRKFQYVKDHNSRAEIIDKGFESAMRNFPKVLIIYMLLFAFFLFLFHSKKDGIILIMVSLRYIIFHFYSSSI